MSSVVLAPARVAARPAALDERAARAQPAIRRFIPLFGTVLWSMWNAPSMRVWFDVITWWRIG